MNAQTIMRIKAIARMFDVDTKVLNDDILLRIWRAAKCSEWAIVETIIQEAK